MAVRLRNRVGLRVLALVVVRLADAHASHADAARARDVGAAQIPHGHGVLGGGGELAQGALEQARSWRGHRT